MKTKFDIGEVVYIYDITKGIVEGTDGEWIHFDYVPGEADVRTGSASAIGRLCVIGAGIDKAKISEAFGIGGN